MRLRTVLPSELERYEVGVLDTLREHFADCDSDLTKTVRVLEADPQSLDVSARIVLAEKETIVGWSILSCERLRSA
jgi:hypothetical protein